MHVPKTGGTSIVRALSDAGVVMTLCGHGLWDALTEREDVEQIVSAVRRSYRITELGTFPQQHLPAAVLKALAGERWTSSFSFAFVRNPWDLMVSSYLFFKKYVPQTQAAGIDRDRAAMLERCDTFERFVQLYPAMRSDCTEMLCDERGECLIDFVGRFETLERDVRAICERIGIQVTLPHLLATEHEGYQAYYTPKTQAAVARHFARDIDRFGYTFA